MGGLISSHEQVIKKNQDYISEMNRIKMERWIQMHYQIKERQRALEISKNREIFLWLSSFYLITVIGCIRKYRTTKRLADGTKTKTTTTTGGGNRGNRLLLPLTFITAYYADLAYGSKLHRIRAEADMIMQHEQELLEWPQGLPTVSSIDEARTEVEMEKKMHPHQT